VSQTGFPNVHTCIQQIAFILGRLGCVKEFFFILVVILCPLSVTDSWMSEIEKFSPQLRVLGYMGEKEHRRMLRRTIHEHVQAQSVSNDVCVWLFHNLG